MATNLFQELKRRKVVRVGVVYAVVGFGVIEVAANTFPNLGLPDSGVTLVIALVILGFPLALVLSWMFDVVSHTSVKRYKGTEKPIAEIATELNVGCVLEGSVRRAGDRVRIVAQLIDAATDRHLWAETYDRHLTDVFAVQSDVARKIADALEAELTEDEQARLNETPTESIEAYELVLKGRFGLAAVTETGLKQALDCYQAALDIQPDYLEALVGLAMVHIALPFWSTLPPKEQSERSAELAGHLTRIDPTSPQAHFVTGVLEMMGGWDWEKARSELDEALRLDSTRYFFRYARALLELWVGDNKHAMEMVLEARELSSGDALIEAWTGQFLWMGGRFHESIEILEPWITQEPLHLMPPLYTGASYVSLGDIGKGLGLIERARGISEGAPLAMLTHCRVLHLAGRGDEAAAVVADLVGRSKDEQISGYVITAALLATGDVERALDHLERALEDRDPILPTIGAVSLWHAMHGNPRFDAVYREVFPGREPPVPE